MSTNRIPAPLPLLQLVASSCCPFCGADSVILDVGDYVARIYCLTCEDLDHEALLTDEYQRQYA